MKRIPRSIKVFVSLFIFFWLALSLSVKFYFSQRYYRVDKHIHPSLVENRQVQPEADDWCVLAASQRFLELSDDVKREMAATFFRDNLERLAAVYFIDVEAFRSWFIRTSTLSVRDAPIEEVNVGAQQVRVRRFPLAGLPRPQGWKYFLDVGHVSAALIFSLASFLVIFVLYLVYQGFAGRRRTNSVNRHQ